jgi:hypothetical protein
MIRKRPSVSRICCSSSSRRHPQLARERRDRLARGGVPRARPACEPIAVARVRRFGEHGERLRPRPVPGAVFAQRKEDLAQQVVAPDARRLADVAEEESIEHRLHAQVQRRERLAPVVRHQHRLDQLAQRLPRRIALPQLPARLAEARPQAAQHRHPVGEAMDAPHLVRRLQRRHDRDAARGRHLADVRRHHLQPVIGVAQRR